VTLFIVVCAVMLLAAVLFVVRPLARAPGEGQGAAISQASQMWSVLGVALGIPLIAALLYVNLSTWSWFADPAASVTGHGAGGLPAIEAMVGDLEQRLRENPADVDGWLLLGRTYVAMSAFPRAVDAYRKAYEQTGPENPEAATGLAEALVLTDEAALSGEAGDIFEAVLARNPNHPKALWYASIKALRAENTRLAQERMERLLALNPPEQIRNILREQLVQLGVDVPPAGDLAAAADAAAAPAVEQPAAAPAAESAAAAPAGRAIQVEVSLAPALRDRVQADLPLFILARDPATPGPPLAAVRRGASQLPLTVTL